MHLLEQYMIEERTTIMDNNIRVRMIGRRDGHPRPGAARARQDRRHERANTGMWLNLAINYGGRAELVDAVRAIGRRDRRRASWRRPTSTKQTIADHLYTAGLADPDLLIRTAGEMRISNFCCGRSATPRSG